MIRSPRTRLGLALVGFFFFVTMRSLADAQEVLVIRGATIHTLGDAGDIVSGSVLIKDGKIEAVGKDLSIPLSAKVIDAENRHLIPGIVAPFFNVNLNQDESPAESRPVTFRGRTAFVPGRSPAMNTSFLKIADSLPPDAIQWQMPTRAGITTMQLVTAGYAQSAFAQQGNDPFSTRIIEANGRLLVTVTNSTQSLDLLRNGLKPGGRPSSAGGPPTGGRRGFGGPGFRRGEGPPPGPPSNPTPTPPPTESSATPSEPTPEQVLWNQVREGNAPLIVTVNNAAAILHVLQVLKEYPKVKLVLVANGQDVYQTMEKLPADRTTIVLPMRFDTIPNTRNRINVPALVAKKFHLILAGARRDADYADLEPNAIFPLAMLVKGGLAEEEALRSVTRYPAELLGLEKKIGTIEAGKTADLVLLDGSPWEPSTSIQQVFQEGRTTYEN